MLIIGNCVKSNVKCSQVTTKKLKGTIKKKMGDTEPAFEIHELDLLDT
jgi:hypothetical protein